MTNLSDLLPLQEIIAPKPARPNLVENIHDALANPVRTVRDYLFTPGIRGYFERIFRDVKESRGGGYWVQAEYGGGKTHFLSTLLCLLGEAGEDTEEEVWTAIHDHELRDRGQGIIRPRRLLGAHMSLMGTAAVLGSEQPRLVDLIDEAVVEALERHGHPDPGISAGSEVLSTFAGLDAGIRGIVENSFRNTHGMSVEEYRREMGDLDAANALIAAVPKGIRIDVELQADEHFIHVVERLRSLGFDGLVIVIDEYFSRQVVLSEAQVVEDWTVLETIAYKLGRQGGLPVYMVVASQGEMPARLSERIDPMALLRDQDKEYSQIVCRRVMDLKPSVAEQSVLYHTYYSRNFQFLRRTSESETREIFPFQPAVFRYLRNLVGSSQINLPSTRFAIGSAYDAITVPGALEVKRFLTTSDLFVGSLEREITGAAEMRETATALRQARDYINESEWAVPFFGDMAHRILTHLFLDSIVGGQAQSVDQIVEGTLVDDPNGMLPAKQVAQAVLRQLATCEQVDGKGDSWRFSSSVTEGEQFETIFQKVRKGILRSDPRIEQKWSELLTAPVTLTGGVPTFLSSIVTPMRVPTDYCGVEFPGRAQYGQGGLARYLAPLERITQPERCRIVVMPTELDEKPTITDAAIAVVTPASLPETGIDEIRGLLACQDVLEDYSLRVEPGVEKIRSAAKAKSQDLIKAIIARAKEAYREGEVYTKEDVPLNAKQLFKDGLAAGLAGIAQQLVRAAYPRTQSILNGALARKGSLGSGDAAKVFDGIFGGLAEAKTKGAAEIFGPVLGLTSAKERLRLTWNPGHGPDAVASYIATNPNCSVAEIYDQFCNEPYGLPNDVVDLFIFACVAMNRPYPIEIRPASGVMLETRDRRGFNGPIRANQIRQLQWPRGLRGCTITPSRETTWNDFAPVAQAIDPEQFSLTTDPHEIESQERTLLLRLQTMGDQITATRNAMAALSEASGGSADDAAVEAIDRLSGLSVQHQDYSRDSILNYVKEQWTDGNPGLVRADIQKLNSLAQLVADAPRLIGKLSWFRELSAAAPEAMQDEVQMTAPLVQLHQLTTGPGQLDMGIRALNELQAKFMARYRAEHAQYAEWLANERQALDRAEKRLPTLARLNRVPQLGPPELPSAQQDVTRFGLNLQPCERPEDPDLGNGLACLSCRYRLGNLDRLDAVGTRAEEAVNAAIERRALSLSQGLIAEALKEAGDNDLMALLAAAQAHKLKDIVEDDLLTDAMLKKINAVLSKAKQQAVSSQRVYDFIAENPHVTVETIGAWLDRLREVLEASLAEASKENPGKEITLLLRSGDGE
jgi:hypothetical protein